MIDRNLPPNLENAEFPPSKDFIGLVKSKNVAAVREQIGSVAANLVGFFLNPASPSLNPLESALKEPGPRPFAGSLLQVAFTLDLFVC